MTSGLPARSRRSRPLDDDAGACFHPLEHLRVAGDAAEHVHRTGGTDLLPAAGRGLAEENAERVTGRPVAEITHLDHLDRRILTELHADGEVDLVTPRLCLRLDGQRL